MRKNPCGLHLWVSQPLHLQPLGLSLGDFGIFTLRFGDVLPRHRPRALVPRRRAEESFRIAPLVRDDGLLRHRCVLDPRRRAEESFWIAP